MTHDDSRYYESWAERQDKRQTKKLRENVKKRRLANGSYIDEDWLRKFKRLWATGMTRKGIALNMDCGTNTVSRLVRELQLPMRQTGRYHKRVNLHVALTRAMNERVNKRCTMTWLRKRDYVIRLIEADLVKHGL